MIRKTEKVEPNKNAIPVAWIKAYAKDNGSEIQDILECMIEAWDKETKKNKK